MEKCVVFESIYDTGFRGPDQEQPYETRPYVDISEALTTLHKTDAAMAAYVIDGEDDTPRLTKESLAWLREQGAIPMLRWIVIDVDLHDEAGKKRKWRTGEVDAALDQVRSSNLTRNATVYTTTHGYRLLWKAGSDIPVTVAQSVLSQLCDALQAEGITADRTCTDWTRLYRLPHIPSVPSAGIYYPEGGCVLPLEWQAPMTWEEQASVVDTDPEWPLHCPFATTPEPPEDLLLALDDERVLTQQERSRLRRGHWIYPPGERHSGYMSAVGRVAKMLSITEPAPLFALFARSAADAPAEGGGSFPEQQLWNICLHVAGRERGHVRKTTRMREALTRKTRERLEHGPANEAGTGRDADDDDSGSGGSTGGGVAGTGSGPVVPPLLIHGNAFYVLDQNTLTYKGPFSNRGDMPMHLNHHCPDLVVLRTSGGQVRGATPLALDYGAVADKVIARMGQTDNLYDPDRGILYERACAPRTDIQPVYHDDVAGWLELIGGDDPDLLLDWLATVQRTDAPTCALYIEGHPGVGKGLLAAGVAALWNATPVPFEHATSARWNEQLLRCPLVWADEQVAADQHGDTPSAILRSLIGNTTHMINRRYMDSTHLIGAPRLLVTANNNKALQIKENLTLQDYSAIVKRIGYIKADPAAKAYLDSLGGRPYTGRHWLGIHGNALLEHLIWLRQNRKVVEGKRFIVEGVERPFHRELVRHWGINAGVLECVAICIDRELDDDEGMFLGNDGVFVNVGYVQQKWAAAFPGEKPPKRSVLMGAFRNLEAARVTVAHGASRATRKRARCWSLPVGEMIEIMESLQIGEPSELRARASREKEWQVYPA
jgi:hypothetical protein